MCIYRALNDKQHHILAAIFADPPSPNIPWSEILSLLRVLSRFVREYDDRVCVAIEHQQLKARGTFHRRRGQIYASPATIKSIRYFLTTVDIEPVE